MHSILHRFCVPMLLLLVTCKVVKEEGSSGLASSVADLQITTEISGWSSDSFKVYAGVEALAASYFDGEAYSYQNLGESALQSFTNAQEWSLLVVTMDFGTPDMATYNYKMKCDDVGASAPTVPMPGADPAVTTLFLTGADFVCYATSGRFLHYIYLGGPTEQTAAAAVADAFLSVYRKKITGK